MQHSGADEELVLAIREGEVGAFDVLYRRYDRRLFGYLLRLLGDHTRVIDAQGKALALLPTMSNGQGHETAYAQLVAYSLEPRSQPACPPGSPARAVASISPGERCTGPG